jgi:hypothetical protein
MNVYVATFDTIDRGDGYEILELIQFNDFNSSSVLSYSRSTILGTIGAVGHYRLSYNSYAIDIDFEFADRFSTVNYDMKLLKNSIIKYKRNKIIDELI